MSDILKHLFPPNLADIYNQKLTNQLANTVGSIQGLNQMSRLLHNPMLLMRPILGKEAESSSQLEGTQASIEDVYQLDIMEQPEEKRNDALEIRNYEDAMLTGIKIINNYGFTPMLIREIHRTLLQGVRGQKKHPGEFRKGDVWVGALGTVKEKARYVPPDAAHVPVLMEELHKFIVDSGELHPLLVCGIVHHRFEAIHPFEDGNGRTGRLLISLYLLSRGLLTYPILYPSGFFEKNRDAYLSALSNVDTSENWYGWLIYFLNGMEVQATLSLETALRIDSLFKESRSKVENERANLNLIKVLEHSFTKPYLTSAIINQSLNIPRTSCDRYLQTLAEKSIVEDIGIINRQRVYVNVNLLSILRAI